MQSLEIFSITLGSVKSSFCSMSLVNRIASKLHSVSSKISYSLLWSSALVSHPSVLNSLKFLFTQQPSLQHFSSSVLVLAFSHPGSCVVKVPRLMPPVKRFISASIANSLSVPPATPRSYFLYRVCNEKKWKMCSCVCVCICLSQLEYKIH